MLHKYTLRLLYISNFIKFIDYYAKSLSEKTLSSFHDIFEEADKVEDETCDRLASLSAPEWFDSADNAERAIQAGADFYLMAQGIVQGIINLFATGLHHLFEQQLLWLHRQELLWPGEENIPKLLCVKEAQQRLLQNYKINVSTFVSWGKLEELRLVANAVKHADGHSCAELKQIRPDLFIPPYVEDASRWYTHVADFPVYQPLAGEDLYISLDEFTRYVGAIKQFWEELAKAVDQLPD